MATMRIRPTSTLFALVALLTLFGVSRAPLTAQTHPPEADPADVESLDAIMAAVYDVISGGKGVERNWDRFRSLFASGARLIPVGQRAQGAPPEAMAWTPDEYIERAGGQLMAGGFFEDEIGRTVETYGSVVHAFSAYQSKRTPDGEVFARGINSFQLLNDGTRWWVVSIYWQGETPDNLIPEKYIGR
jgi:hypothetical protein